MGVDNINFNFGKNNNLNIKLFGEGTIKEYDVIIQGPKNVHFNTLAHSIFKKFSNEDGTIDKNKMNEIMTSLDKDQNGEISKDEAKEFLKSLGMPNNSDINFSRDDLFAVMDHYVSAGLMSETNKLCDIADNLGKDFYELFPDKKVNTSQAPAVNETDKPAPVQASNETDVKQDEPVQNANEVQAARKKEKPKPTCEITYDTKMNKT